MHTEQIERIKSLLIEPKNTVIIPHINPDGDAMGAALGLFHFLKKYDHDTTIVAPNGFPEFYDWMPGAERVVIFEEDKQRATALLENADVVFCVDFNEKSRAGDDIAAFIDRSKELIVMIDHHREPTGFAQICISDHTKSSTSEMVYDLIVALGGTEKIDRDIAACLYTGIVTDTGGFRYNSTTPDTHCAASRLLESGMDAGEIYTRVYDNNSIDRMRLIGYALYEKLRVIPGTVASVISLSADELSRFKYRKGDTEGLVNYGLGIKDIAVTGFLREEGGSIRVSLRSKGDFDVNKLARKYFEGGGHKNAAGGNIYKPMDEALAYFEQIMKQYAAAKD